MRVLAPFALRLTQPSPILLDGATGTELARRGFSLPAPLWSAAALIDAPDLLRAIHSDYVAAGAQVLTANTFRTHARSLAAAGLANQAAELTKLAVQLARTAANGLAWVLGSQAPLEDCYRPDLVPENATLQAEHTQMAQHLALAGVDGILVETHNCVREVRAATQAACATGLPVLVSVVCSADGRLLSGETLAEAVSAVEPYRPAALLVNCSTAPDLHRPLRQLAALAGTLPFGGYANTGRLVNGHWQPTTASQPEKFVVYAHHWLDLGARIVGGCCGTTPAHIAKLKEIVT